MRPPHVRDTWLLRGACTGIWGRDAAAVKGETAVATPEEGGGGGG